MGVIIKRGILLGTVVLMSMILAAPVTGSAASDLSSDSQTSEMTQVASDSASQLTASDAAKTADQPDTETSSTTAVSATGSANTIRKTVASVTVIFQSPGNITVSSPVKFTGVAGQLLPALTTILPVGYSVLSGTYYGFIQPGTNTVTITVVPTAELSQMQKNGTDDIATVVTPGSVHTKETTKLPAGERKTAANKKRSETVTSSQRATVAATAKTKPAQVKVTYHTAIRHPKLNRTDATMVSEKTLPHTSEAAGSVATFSGWGLLAGVIGLFGISGIDDKKHK